MEYPCEIEHERDGMEEYDHKKFDRAQPELLKVVKILTHLGMFPRIGEELYANLEGDGQTYYVKGIIYYDDSYRLYVDEEKE